MLKFLLWSRKKEFSHPDDNDKLVKSENEKRKWSEENKIWGIALMVIFILPWLCSAMMVISYLFFGMGFIMPYLMIAEANQEYGLTRIILCGSGLHAIILLIFIGGIWISDKFEDGFFDSAIVVALVEMGLVGLISVGLDKGFGW